MKQLNLLAEDSRLERLTELGDPLTKVATLVDWEMFRPVLDSAFQIEAKGPGGRPSMDRVMMFKVVMLQQWYNIADDSTEYAINDRLSFQRFLGLTLDDKVVDAKTIWAFKEHLKNTGADKLLFQLFTQQMETAGVITKTGTLVDATFVEVPVGRNTRKENKEIKEGKTPEDWSEAKKAQKDTDAKWTKKNNKNYFGYKNHAKVDKDSKMIISFEVTPANVHDSQIIEYLIEPDDKAVWADSAYSGNEIKQKLKSINPNIEINIIKKAYRNRPLTEKDKKANHLMSKVRCRVEHPFGHIAKAMNGMATRAIGLARTTRDISFKNLAYNVQRYVSLSKLSKI